MTRHFQIAAMLACLLITFGLSACGSDDKPDQTATPAPTQAAGPTVGSLSDQIAAAWSSVTTYRMVSRGLGGILPGSATPGTPSSAPQIKGITEVILPDRKHQLTTSNGEVQEEFLVVDGKLYARGPQSQALPATPTAGDWRLVEEAAVDPQSPEGQLVAALVAPVESPYSGLSADQRERDAKPLGSITVDGRTCQTFQIVDTTQTGERIDITLALGSDNLPCSIETKAGGTTFVTTYTFNIPLSITAPAATPSPTT